MLHLAGVYESTQLTDTTADRWRADTRAKVAGSKAVAEVLRRRPGSRLVAFSSLLTWFPGVGAGAYAAGNRYLEAVAERLGADHPVHTLIWGLWRSTGMNAGHDYREAAVRGKLLSFPPAEGANLFTAALRLPPGPVLLGVDRTNPVARRMLPPEPLEGAALACRDAFGVDIPVAPARRPRLCWPSPRRLPGRCLLDRCAGWFATNCAGSCPAASTRTPRSTRPASAHWAWCACTPRSSRPSELSSR